MAILREGEGLETAANKLADLARIKLTRRQFLKGAAVFGAGVAVGAVGATALGAAQTVPETVKKMPDVPDEIPAVAVPNPDLSTDIISSRELLEEYHVRIWNPSNFELQLRRGIGRDPFFRLLPQNDQYYGMPGELDVLVVDGPVVQSKFLTDQQKRGSPEALRMLEEQEQRALAALREDYERDREKMTEQYRQSLAQAEKDYQAGRIGSVDQYKELLSKLEGAYRFYLQGPSEEDLIPSSAKSQYEQVIDKLDGGRERRHHYVFVSAQLPRPSHSYPSVADLGIQNNPGDPYPIKRVTAPIVLRHEIKHGLGLNHPDTDFAVVKDIEAANAAWKAGDSSLYWVTFRYPDGAIFIS